MPLGDPKAMTPKQKADLVVAQLKDGHPEESARLIREMLIELQAEMPMARDYATDPAKVLATTPAELKKFLAEAVKRADGKPDTQAIIDSLVDNTVSKNYPAQLKDYFKRLQSATTALDEFKTVTDSESLNYGDPLHDLNDLDPANKTDPKISATKLDKLGQTLVALSSDARSMPLADMQAPFGLYRLALAANSAQRYGQAEMFARQSIDSVNSIGDDFPMLAEVKLALAYCLLKQGKKDEFNSLKEELLKRYDDQERLIVTLARFSENGGDDAGALSLYQRVLEKREKRGDKQTPEWMNDYKALSEKLKPAQ